MKKLLSALLAATLCVGMSVSAFAAEEPEYVVKPAYDQINPYSDGYTTAKKGSSWYILDAKGTAKQLPFNAAYLKTHISGVPGVTAGKTKVEITSFSNGLAKVMEVPTDRTGATPATLCFINTKGRVVLDYSISPDSKVSPKPIVSVAFSEGIAATAPFYASDWTNEKIEYVNKKGTVLFTSPQSKAMVTTIKSFSEGVSGQLLADNTLRYLNTAGQVVFSLPNYTSSGNFTNGYAWVGNTSGKEGLINLSGKLVIPANYAAIGDVGTDGLVCFRKTADGLMGLMDLNQNVVVPAKFKSLYSPAEGVTYASEDGKTFGIINTKGEYLIAPQYQAVGTSSDGLIGVQTMSGKCGVIKNPLVN